jgi:hypothetical protein
LDDWIDYYDSTHTIYASKRSPHRAEHHPEMPPVIGVDRKAFADGAGERGEDRKVGALPVYADEDVAKIPRSFSASGHD